MPHEILFFIAICCNYWWSLLHKSIIIILIVNSAKHWFTYNITIFISGRALKPIGEFSDKIEEVQLQNLSDSQIEENQVKELNRLSVSYNKMLERLSEAFKIQRQFTENAIKYNHSGG